MAARREYEEKYTPAKNLQELLRIYEFAGQRRGEVTDRATAADAGVAVCR